MVIDYFFLSINVGSAMQSETLSDLAKRFFIMLWLQDVLKMLQYLKFYIDRARLASLVVVE